MQAMGKLVAAGIHYNYSALIWTILNLPQALFFKEVG